MTDQAIKHDTYQTMTMEEQPGNPWQPFKDPWTDGTSPPRDVFVEIFMDEPDELGNRWFFWKAYLSRSPGNGTARDVIWRLAGRAWDYRGNIHGSWPPGALARYPERWRWPTDPETGAVVRMPVSRETHPDRGHPPGTLRPDRNHILDQEDITDELIERCPPHMKILMTAAKSGVNIGTISHRKEMTKESEEHLRTMHDHAIVIVNDRTPRALGPTAFKQPLLRGLMRGCPYIALNCAGLDSPVYEQAATFVMAGRGAAMIIETGEVRENEWAAYVQRVMKGRTQGTYETAGKFPLQGDIKPAEPVKPISLGPVITPEIWEIICDRVADLIAGGFTDPVALAERFAQTMASPQMSERERGAMMESITRLAAAMLAGGTITFAEEMSRQIGAH
jgi:hypothetical protein